VSARPVSLDAHVPADAALEALLRQLARLVADELRAEVQAELRRLAAVQAAGDEWACSVPEAARLLGVSPATAYRSIWATGSLAGIPVWRVGRQYRVSKLAILDRLMREQAGEADTGLLTTRKELVR
jgi:excisionase family DNA binding protein